MKRTKRNQSGTLPQFQTDYLISWDFSKNDAPVVVVAEVKRNGAIVEIEHVGWSHETAGCISLRQVLERYDEEKRREKKRTESATDLIKKHLTSETEKEFKQ